MSAADPRQVVFTCIRHGVVGVSIKSAEEAESRWKRLFSDERYTPPALLEICRKSLGPEFKDVCGRRRTGGLQQRWAGAVYCNPPGSQVLAFANALFTALTLGDVTRAVWCFYNYDATTDYARVLMTLQPTLAICRDRWLFAGPDRKKYEVGRTQAFAIFGDADPAPFAKVADLFFPRRAA